MSNIEIYSLIPPNLNKGLERMRINLTPILAPGNKNIAEVTTEVKENKKFCRDEIGISYNYFVSLISSDISIYALLDGKIAGLLTFMILEDLEGKKFLLHGLCSPIEYANKNIGKILIETLIKMGKLLNINYIELQCKGDFLMNYYRKFGFIIKYKNINYDSDDEEEDDAYYNMSLDLSKTTGGKKKSNMFKKISRTKTRTQSNKKRQNTRRK